MPAQAPSYLSDRSPGSGSLPARSTVRTDAPQIDLNGEWAFRLRPTAAVDEATDDLPLPDLDDAQWDRIVVPSSWVLDERHRWGTPIYTNIQYPFPVDPPAVPDENPTGEYRRHVDVPESLVGDGRTVLRLDGVESTYRVWWNGTPVGVGKGSRLAHEFDVTDLVHPGRNTVAIRVHQWSDASYLEDQDQWWLPGIFRDVTLVSRPAGAVEDVWLRTSFRDGVAGLDPEVRADPGAFPVRLTVDELGVDVLWSTPEEVGPLTLPGAQPWSAEDPRLYTATVANDAETLTLRLGFRTVEVVGDRLLANGRRLVFHGMNRHEAHPERGRVFDEEHARADLARMKRFNVTAIRTSHYPPHPRLLDLADEIGLWVVLECDLETHGFAMTSTVQGDAAGERVERLRRLSARDDGHVAPGPSPWAGNPSDDLEWREAYLDRIRRTVERDKNHASVVVWSLGNESGTGCNLAAMAAWVHDRDPGRPVHYEGDYAGAYTDVYSRMYATVPETESIGTDDGALLLGCSAAESTRQRSKPFLQCEYVHAMGNGPGGIAQYEDLVDRLPRLHGGFVWEWRDHGLRSTTPDGRPFFAYGGDFDEVVHDGNFVMDGMVLSDDTPTPGLVEYAAVAAPFRICADGPSLRIANRRHSRGTEDVEVVWAAESSAATLATGRFDDLDVPAGASVSVPLPDAPAVPEESWLTVEVRTRGASTWAPAGHVLARGQVHLSGPGTAAGPRPKAVPTGPRRDGTGPAEPGPAEPGPVELGPAGLDGATLTALAGMAASGPTLELYRAPTDNDARASHGSYDLADPRTAPDGVPAPPVAETWTRVGLDRLAARVLAQGQDDSGAWERTRWGAAAGREFVLTETTWQPTEAGVLLTVDVLPSAGWDMTWPRIGIRFALPRDLERAEWFGLGPGEAYPDSMAAARLGRWSSSIDALTTEYAVPQESGHRPGLRELVVSGPAGALRVEAVADSAGRLPGFTLRRHTPQQVAAARHPHELPEPTHTWLTVDAAQHGLGSRACGPDVWPDAALRPHARTIRLHLSAADRR